jgi:hypothetical protein
MNKYTAAQRKIIHNHLVKAKPWLWDGQKSTRKFKIEYICWAISRGVGGLSIYPLDVKMTMKMIQDRLGKYNGYQLEVETYLMYILNIDHMLMTGENLQAYRHRWLDSLIKEFSK